ncbi:MAG: hypothetical protein COV29_04200 [Candidatus Yanofskybacteria bacterium CG10_big_fil_rev_8_21_14_0_10_36_16]|uniref:Uncharacterized protein n=1 Tax=Candidatus Yanofskybacteria bacterium CG10_big_fil_rev_8_21_14_0_10_36_16 TaxID=1975096 RepID=A0A2J0Q6D0_9BACT|nr:MAG: hypothetical protein COV29_04200 [Candidatus Yanofskybacteria bacterium CG10_big_fil_rev_8_21_14_0_10_36_16]
MYKINKTQLLSSLLIVSMMVMVGFPFPLYAQEGLGIEDFSVKDLVAIATGLACWTFYAAMFGLVIFFMVEAVKLMSAKGDVQKSGEARKGLMYAFIAAVVIFGVGTIVVTVANAVGVEVTFTCEIVTSSISF